MADAAAPAGTWRDRAGTVTRRRAAAVRDHAGSGHENAPSFGKERAAIKRAGGPGLPEFGPGAWRIEHDCRYVGKRGDEWRRMTVDDSRWLMDEG